MAAKGKARQEGVLRGRFTGGVHPALDHVNRSFDVDRRMAAEDLRASRAHAEMLGACGIVPKSAVRRILRGLKLVGQELADGTFTAHPGDEDVHMAVERRLTELVGEDGKRLHTARSRNDQVATDLLLYLAGAAERLRTAVRGVQSALLALVASDGEHVLPFYTHLQRAQPVLLGHVLLAYVEMLDGDHDALRFELEECPLGSGAGVGTTFPIDRRMTAKALGFRRPSGNSLVSVSSRRQATALAAAMAGCAVTLSRLGGDLVNWTSREFGFARLGDAVSTGSSIMPQKRNPDGAELLRAMAVRVTTAHGALLEIQRGLPLGYFKDLQEDKVHLFTAEDALGGMLAVAEAMLGDLVFDADRMRAAVEEPSGYLLATEAADWLVVRGVPFREAHEAVGRLVREAESRGVALAALDDEALAACHPTLDGSVRRVLTPEAALKARRAVGGTAPQNVRRSLARWQHRIGGRRT